MAEKNTVPFKTVKEYQEYMKGSPDDDRTLRHNPPPTDGMTLSELGQKSDEEILAIINSILINLGNNKTSAIAEHFSNLINCKPFFFNFFVKCHSKHFISY